MHVFNIFKNLLCIFSVLTATLLSTAMAQQAPSVDLLNLARGAIPIAINGTVKDLKVGMDQALQLIDGDSSGFVLTAKPVLADTSIIILYELPALTTFESFAIPNVQETPSPSQTFVSQVSIAGSASGRDGPFKQLAATTLKTHTSKDELTAFPASTRLPIRWLQVTLKGGIHSERDRTFLEFSEISGFGSQQQVPLSETFTGKWKGRGSRLELKQEGVRVSGCYDGVGDLNGTVSGNLLHATGKTRSSNIPSTFVLSVGSDDEIFGVRSTNGAPFRLYQGSAAPSLTTECSAQAVAKLGCGSVIHGIQFDFDSSNIRADSTAYLDALYDGLQSSKANKVSVIGHTSSEGSDAYNESLSLRRAKAVTAAIIARGFAAGRLSAQGRGEQQPIADNKSETGRSLNRRVEIECH